MDEERSRTIVSVHRHPANPSGPGGPGGTQPQSNGNGNGTGGKELASRVSALEAHMQHLATKNDVSQLKIWILGGLLAAFLLAGGWETSGIQSIINQDRTVETQKVK